MHKNVFAGITAGNAAKRYSVPKTLSLGTLSLL